MTSSTISPQQFAKAYAIGVKKVIRWIRAGILGAIQTGDGSRKQRYRIRQSDVDAWERRREVVVKPARRRRVTTKADSSYIKFFEE